MAKGSSIHPIEGKVLESYEVTSDHVPAKVTISEVWGENVAIYDVKLPNMSQETDLLIVDIMNQLSSETKVSKEEITNPTKLQKLREKFFINALDKVKGLFPNSTLAEQKCIAGIIVQTMYGFGKMDIIMADNLLEEICLNRSDRPISVYHKHYGWLKTTTYVDSEEQIYNYAAMIGRKVGREINNLNPIMDAHLVSGDRVAATLFPISSSGNTITFRRFSRSPWTITHFVSEKFGVMTKDIAALLWQALEYELNILVCGGTASGKTSVLNALCALLPKNQRIISVEDTREFVLPRDLNWNWIPMVSRKENTEGEGSISMLDLIVASLRMRPDRIIVGEVRKREQAETMFEAMHTGHSVYTTMHADTVEQLTRRILEPPISIPKNEAEALHLVLVQHRDRKRNVRRTLEVAEVLRGGIMDDELKVNYLYRWRPKSDTFEKVDDCVRIVEDLNLRTGMTPKEMQEDLDKRKTILEWMVKNEVFKTDSIGKVMKSYYKDREKLLEFIRQNKTIYDVLSEA
ncbi:MAG: type II/IV secretion system ATPase subunit [Candidatus Nanoarchaeia archaeon]